MQKRLQGFKDQGELEASQSRSGWTRLYLILYWCRDRSLLNLTHHRAKEGFCCLNILSLRSFQIFHAAHTKISIKHGPVNLFLAAIHWAEKSTPDSHCILSIFQQEVANEHSKKRCSLVYRTCELHKTQAVPPSTCQFFLSIRSFVFNRSMISNQANTLSFGRHLEFQIIFSTGSSGTAANINL
jgi:hypothetical protein